MLPKTLQTLTHQTLKTLRTIINPTGTMRFPNKKRYNYPNTLNVWCSGRDLLSLLVVYSLHCQSVSIFYFHRPQGQHT